MVFTKICPCFCREEMALRKAEMEVTKVIVLWLLFGFQWFLVSLVLEILNPSLLSSSKIQSLAWKGICYLSVKILNTNFTQFCERNILENIKIKKNANCSIFQLEKKLDKAKKLNSAIFSIPALW